METYLKKEYSAARINQRLKSLDVRKESTDKWEEHGITEGLDFANSYPSDRLAIRRIFNKIPKHLDKVKNCQ